ncbi:Protein of unknown function DUF4246 [Penicillium canariense]|uniref:Uncharacterized protein n=1 Tax=Penicillium canariense TaxID=189055 RepID=A0A9W9LIJ7_9EURO|nr:Protein of unknown function DUF4246 [Penicillium canariense]KAJ5156925.1 Protein of unknown function DUF4246 [Penicillium canariense]
MTIIIQRLHFHPRLLGRARKTHGPLSSSRGYSEMTKMDSSPIKLDNSGNGPLRVPGSSGVPLYYEHSKGNRFAHGIADWRQIPQLFLREVSMLELMSFVTDQPGWDKKSTDAQTLEDWHQHAVSLFDLDEPSWQWCVKELRYKASDFQRTGYVAAFDADSRVIKTLVHDDLLDELRQSLSPLFSESRSVSSLSSGDSPEPEFEGPVRHVVDPFMYPLVYGRTRVLTDGSRVDLDRPESWRWSQSRIAPIPDLRPDRYEMHPEEREKKTEGIPGRTPMRIRTYDFQVEGIDHYPKLYYDLYHVRQRRKPPFTEEWPVIQSRVRDYLALPEPEKRHRIIPGTRSHDLLAGMQPWQWDSLEALEELIIEKNDRLYAVKGVEPGISFTYEEWKTGKTTGRAIMPKLSEPDYPEYLPSPDPDHQYYTIALQDQFEGLQVIVRVSTVELTPERPLYGGDAHHNIAGILNEHIVATAICYFDMHNIKDAKISFRQETKIDGNDYNVDEFMALNQVFDLPESDCDGPFPPAPQTLGSIPISRIGQFLTWPNTLRSKAEPFGLADPSQPGHLRFATLWLVDPHYRVCSTLNVPPQDLGWVEISESMENAGKDDSMTFAQAVEIRNQMRHERDKISMHFLLHAHKLHNYSWDLWRPCGRGHNK